MYKVQVTSLKVWYLSKSSGLKLRLQKEFEDGLKKSRVRSKPSFVEDDVGAKLLTQPINIRLRRYHVRTTRNQSDGQHNILERHFGRLCLAIVP